MKDLSRLAFGLDVCDWPSAQARGNIEEAAMHVTEKGQITIPKRIRTAAGITPGSEVDFSLEGRRIVITPVATHVRDDRRAALRKAAARARASMAPEFRQLGADEIMAFLRGNEPVKHLRVGKAPAGGRK